MNRKEQQTTQTNRREGIQNAWNNRRAQNNQRQTKQNTPVPDKADGTFTMPSVAYPYNGNNKLYKGWIYSVDKNGSKILINPNNLKQAVFMN